MLTYLRYALATFCFAASVACLTLWICGYEYNLEISPASWCARVDGSRGLGCIAIEPSLFHEKYILHVSVENTSPKAWFEDQIIGKGRFGAVGGGVYFPLWYPALVFALAGVGVIRFRRQFSIRSALIAFAIVAALLAMPLML
ncbi:hypothetical protein [Lacipirellula limnantheis]|uniref:Uncharacterized protein n=1 Tax=Lacipirellula limnantheis TaxID=2528024 RepID=A0A517TVQ1_9BACT|nr:hypothetical protein [Lacipirellula limnantheis]QDT72453.1 hypothetical protein I41_16310 [Lacipirellula limnantheis]